MEGSSYIEEHLSKPLLVADHSIQLFAIVGIDVRDRSVVAHSTRL